MKLNKTTILLMAAILLSAVPLAADNSFESCAGAVVEVQPEQAGMPEIYVKGLFTGQYTLNDAFTIRGDFQFRTDDIIGQGVFQDTPSYFTINELSGSYNFFNNGSAKELTLFIGERDSYGSDSFVSRMLGLRSFTSALLKPRAGAFSAGLFPYSGIGASYAMDFGSSALGIYGFYDTDLITRKRQIHTDGRYAADFDGLVIDTEFGVSLPIESETPSGEKVVLLIRNVMLHAGISTLLNTTDRLQLFIQAGLNNIQLPELQAITLNNLYFVAEPRMTLPYFDVSVSFFCLPDNTVKNLDYISKTLGFGLGFKSLPFIMFSHKATAGFYFTAAAPRIVTSYSSANSDIMLSPFLNYSLYTGELNAALYVHPLKIQKISELAKLSISYKAQL